MARNPALQKKKQLKQVEELAVWHPKGEFGIKEKHVRAGF
jgi:hypothetical protein